MISLSSWTTESQRVLKLDVIVISLMVVKAFEAIHFLEVETIEISLILADAFEAVDLES